MPTEALPGERAVVLRETLAELWGLIESRRRIDPDMFDAVAMLLTDAILDGDDRTLEDGQRQLKKLGNRMTQLLNRGEIPDSSGLEVGRILGYIEIIIWAKRRIVPKYVLEQLGCGTSFRRILELLAKGHMSSVNILRSELTDIRRDHLVADLRWLGENLLVTTRQLGDITYWEITPKGRQALYQTR